jgi:methylated-DNA-[protein]-cysteine S-methyltransferase
MNWQTRLGPVGVQFDRDGAITRLKIGGLPQAEPIASNLQASFSYIRYRIDQYLDGHSKSLSDIPIRLSGTAFELRVWEELRKIPYGDTVTYGQLAIRLGDARSARAVGGACARNPIELIVPCHRVIGATGRLRGFAGGMDVKRYLLSLEQGQLSLEADGFWPDD